jgi:hypothetical protein
MAEPKGHPVRLDTGQDLKCLVCGHDRFGEDTNLRMGWRTVDAYTCAQCRYMHLFRRRGFR